MQLPSNVAVVIPCLNEGATIGALVQSVRQIIPHVIVVDDGSADATAELAAQAGAEVLRHKQSKGKGRALNTGWRRARERGFEWALAMDGDGQHLTSDIANFLSAIAESRCDLIVGNRFVNPGKMPWLRRKVNEWMSKRLSRVAGIPLPDSQCGFRLMRLGAWSTLQLRAEHYEVESEVLLAFIARGFAVRFVPVQTIYGTERSKIHPVRDTLRWFRWWRGMQAVLRKPANICIAPSEWARINPKAKT